LVEHLLHLTKVVGSIPGTAEVSMIDGMAEKVDWLWLV
jgi:hypothetical protein